MSLTYEKALERVRPVVTKIDMHQSSIAEYIGNRNNQLKELESLKNNINHVVDILGKLEKDNQIEVDVQIFDEPLIAGHSIPDSETLLFLKRDDNSVQGMNAEMKQRLFKELIWFLQDFYRERFTELEIKINKFTEGLK